MEVAVFATPLLPDASALRLESVTVADGLATIAVISSRPQAPSARRYAARRAILGETEAGGKRICR